jgi:hypothetical protein
MDTHSGQCAGESEGGVHQRPNVVTTVPVGPDVHVGENIAHGADVPDTVRLRSASHVGGSMVLWRGAVFHVPVSIIQKKKEDGICYTWKQNTEE